MGEAPGANAAIDAIEFYVIAADGTVFATAGRDFTGFGDAIEGALNTTTSR